MHGNWAKIRVFDQALLRKLSAAIEGHPGKRGREEDGEHVPDKKLPRAQESTATAEEIELTIFKGSEVLYKLHHKLRLPSRTRLWGFYIYHLVMTTTTFPTDFREAPVAAVAALLLACKVCSTLFCSTKKKDVQLDPPQFVVWQIRDTYVPVKRLVETYEDFIPQHLQALHVRHRLRERVSFSSWRFCP